MPHPIKTLTFLLLLALGFSSAQTSSKPGMYTNPVLNKDFPDPFVLRVDKTFYAYATNNAGNDIQLARSSDLVKWEQLGNALEKLASWASSGWTWAPEVAVVPDGYAMYYTARHTESGRQCIGVATSSSPTGPFVDTSSKPLVCQLDEGGSIDPSPFTDTDGQRYLYWKNDGNCCYERTYIYGQRLSSDGLSLVGEPKRLIVNDAIWEGILVEAPTMFKRQNVAKYYLFFSAASYYNDSYGVGYAHASSPLGNFQKWKANPVLSSRGKVAGPGHQCITLDDVGQPWMVYHAWTDGFTGYPNGQRSMRIDKLEFRADGVPVILPTTTPQVAPVLH